MDDALYNALCAVAEPPSGGKAFVCSAYCNGLPAQAPPHAARGAVCLPIPRECKLCFKCLRVALGGVCVCVADFSGFV